MLALIKYFHTTKDEYKPLIYQNFYNIYRKSITCQPEKYLMIEAVIICPKKSAFCINSYASFCTLIHLHLN